jgi:hypothetical protein
VRRPAVLLSIALLVGTLLARHLRRRHALCSPLVTPEPSTQLHAPLEPGTRFVRVSWTLVEASPTEPRLTIRYGGDVGMELDRVDAQETPTQVFVTVLMRRLPAAGGSPAPAQEHEAVLPLAQPLGERELVHAPVDSEAPAGPSPDPADGDPNDPPLYP